MPVATLKDLPGSTGAAGGYDGGGRIDGEKLPTDFMGIYHEKQIGSLCAVHALNNLLQGAHMHEVGLAEIAHGLDAQERQALGGAVLEAESQNVRADGFFSVQVITSAFQGLGLTSTPIGAESARGASAAPDKEVGFLLNRSQHWLAFRRLGTTWFDLTSMLPRPRILSASQLAEALKGAAGAGYSVFVVRGPYPPAPIEASPARLKAAVAGCADNSSGKPLPPIFDAFSGHGQTLSGARAAPAAAVSAADENLRRTDPELAAALAASLVEAHAVPKRSAEDEAAEVRRKRLERFGGN
jgi:ataxin-3